MDVDRSGKITRGEVTAAVAARLDVPANQHLTLCDITAMNIQAQSIVGAFAGLVGSPDIRSRKLAFVTAGTLARLQARRLTDRPDVQFFTDADTALAWLYRQCRCVYARRLSAEWRTLGGRFIPHPFIDSICLEDRQEITPVRTVRRCRPL